MSLFNRTAIEVCEGQQMDMDYESQNNVNMNDYLRMIELKTSVALAASLKVGACLVVAVKEIKIFYMSLEKIRNCFPGAG